MVATASVAIVGFLALAGRAPGAASLVLYAGYLALSTLVGVCFSLAASVLFVRYRDLNQVWDVVVQAGFFVSPIVYPLDVLPEHLHRWLYLWPPTAVIEFSRSVLIAGVAPSARARALLVAVAAASLLPARSSIGGSRPPRPSTSSGGGAPC